MPSHIRIFLFALGHSMISIADLIDLSSKVSVKVYSTEDRKSVLVYLQVSKHITKLPLKHLSFSYQAPFDF